MQLLAAKPQEDLQRKGMESRGDERGGMGMQEVGSWEARRLYPTRLAYCDLIHIHYELERAGEASQETGEGTRELGG